LSPQGDAALHHFVSAHRTIPWCFMAKTSWRAPGQHKSFSA
jgi:hypothetical protein